MVYNSLVDVRVEAGTLWIGASAYPLKNISAVQPIQYTYTKPKTQQFSGCAVIVAWVVAAGAIGGGLSAAHLGTLNVIVQVLLIAGAVLLYVKGRKPEQKWTYYQLHIGSGGVKQVVLNVASEDVAYEITRKITNAIDNPDNVFNMQVQTINIDHLGDKNTTSGANSPISTGQNAQSPWDRS
jgi:hypothetical protein